MIDKSRPALGTAQPPEFLPVPRHSKRHDGWSPERQKGFIEALMATGSVRAAAHAVNMTPEGAYHLRRHPQAASFRKAWEQALAHGIQRLEDLAMDRALNGEEVPVYSYGKLIGSRRVYNDRLLMFLLRNRAPTRFAASAQGMGIVRQQNEERLRRQWRKQWEAEQQAESPDSAATHARITARLNTMARQLRESMSPETRELYERYQAAHEADRTRLGIKLGEE
ncbi:hypothetical protein H7F51_17665 [Novosphingobium flavum]|uniref:Uncharacterized protein n=1 Tax=Novosphingobium flavum TaxID=1778672 RepID=A0A7X1KNG8_9SPHN|nr:hypothetical protein [Novosphingobium flavum]MBC2667350.1 hypothetical protein [Novosphingobium flavum]